MSLRKRTLLVISGVLISLVLILWGAAEFILMDRFTGLEITRVRLDTTRILEMIDSELDALSRTNRDWSAWDDTCNYVQSGSPEYIKNNLDEETFVNLRFRNPGRDNSESVIRLINRPISDLPSMVSFVSCRFVPLTRPGN